MRCEEVRQQVLEQTLQGSPPHLPGLPARHLQDCPECQAFLARLAVVDAALWELPLEPAPAGLAACILERLPTPTRRSEDRFLPWSLWLPALSLVVGILVACMALLTHQGPALSGMVDPALAGWLTQAEQWLASNQAVLSAVSLSVTLGLLFTLVAISLGLYVGRSRPAHVH